MLQGRILCPWLRQATAIDQPAEQISKALFESAKTKVAEPREEISICVLMHKPLSSAAA